MSTLLRYGVTKTETKITEQSGRIDYLEGEVKALKLARGFLDSSIKGKEVNLRQMRNALSRMKAISGSKERYESYKEKVAGLKRKITKSNEQMLQEELNEMELKGKP